MDDFNTYVGNFQTEWRKSHIKTLEKGNQNGKEYPWILPKHLWEEGLWAGTRSGEVNSLPAYLEQTGVQKHDGVHNLKSSWMLCANLYFPFCQDLRLITGFLKQHISAEIKTVDKIELEWAEESPLDPTTILGEPHGQRGKNQTSPDVAFLVTLNSGDNGIVLMENKFVEHSFYPCSGRKRDYQNPNPRRCMDFQRVYADTANQCYQLQWANEERANRKYWDYIKFSLEAINTLNRCPAATSGYQLFRQQALAEALAQSGKYELVVSCVAYDARNETLVRSLHGTGIDDFTTGWGPLFEGKAKFATFTHQEWVRWVRENDSGGRWKGWFEYVGDRYGLGA